MEYLQNYLESLISFNEIKNNSYLCIGHYRDKQTAHGTVVLTSILIMPLPAAQSLSMFQSILPSLGKSINHDNSLYISNYYIFLIYTCINRHAQMCMDTRIPKP